MLEDDTTGKDFGIRHRELQPGPWAHQVQPDVLGQLFQMNFGGWGSVSHRRDTFSTLTCEQSPGQLSARKPFQLLPGQKAPARAAIALPAVIQRPQGSAGGKER